MRKYGIILLCFGLAAGVMADTVKFGGSDWSAQGLVYGGTSSTAAITTNDITFTLSVTGSGNLSMGGKNLDNPGVIAIDGKDITDGEWIEFSLSVAGTGLTDLEQIFLTDGTGVDQLGLALGSFRSEDSKGAERFSASDGSTTLTNLPNVVGEVRIDSFGYGNYLNGLTALDIDNVGGKGDGTWKLRVLGESASSFSAKSLTFEYVIPEPATFGLLSIAGIGLLAFRRYIK